MKLPIFDCRDGRTVIGYAIGIRGANVAIRRAITIPAGFTLYVWRRSQIVQDCLKLPDGYCYAIGYRYAGENLRG